MEKNKINRSILELNDKFNILNSEIHNLKLVLSKVNNTTQPIKKYNTNEFKEEQFKEEEYDDDTGSSVPDILTEDILQEIDNIREGYSDSDSGSDSGSDSDSDSDDLKLLNKLSVKELKDICKELSLPISGNKNKLIERIIEKKNIN